MSNIPKNARQKVTNLEGVDTANRIVIENKDGSYDLFAASSTGLERIKQQEDSQIAMAFDMSDVPENLVCVLTKEFLREAVTLPCCKKSVNDSHIRQALLGSGLKCPLCGTDAISPDAVSPVMESNPVWN